MTTITFWILMNLVSIRSASPEAVALPPFQTQQECQATLEQVLAAKTITPTFNLRCYHMTMVATPEGSTK